MNKGEVMNRKRVTRNTNSFTSLLHTRPSFLEGVARIVDFGNLLQRYSIPLSQIVEDEKAIQADWAVICEDFHNVTEVA